MEQDGAVAAARHAQPCPGFGTGRGAIDIVRFDELNRGIAQRTGGIRQGSPHSFCWSWGDSIGQRTNPYRRRRMKNECLAQWWSVARTNARRNGSANHDMGRRDGDEGGKGDSLQPFPPREFRGEASFSSTRVNNFNSYNQKRQAIVSTQRAASDELFVQKCTTLYCMSTKKRARLRRRAESQSSN